jgi:hypothetical protein
MKHWSTTIEKHYLKANTTFAQMAELSLGGEMEFGHFTPDLLV